MRPSLTILCCKCKVLLLDHILVEIDNAPVHLLVSVIRIELSSYKSNQSKMKVTFELTTQYSNGTLEFIMAENTALAIVFGR